MITDYTSLQTAIADTLNKTNLTDAIPTFIQLAEGKLFADRRVRKLHNKSDYTVSTSPANLPDDCGPIESLEHVGPTYFGPISIVGSGQIGIATQQAGGVAGVPRVAARVGNQLRFGPPPDGSYTLNLAYWVELKRLGDTVTTNWLLIDHPEAYLHAACMEAAPYLKGDERITVWDQLLQNELNMMNDKTERMQFSGTLTRRPRRTLG